MSGRGLPCSRRTPSAPRAAAAAALNCSHAAVSLLRSAVTFIENDGSRVDEEDPKGPGANDEPSDRNIPGAKVRRQTRDLAALLLAVGTDCSYYFFAEDDLDLCPHALTAIQEALHRVCGTTARAIRWPAASVHVAPHRPRCRTRSGSPSVRPMA